MLNSFIHSYIICCLLHVAVTEYMANFEKKLKPLLDMVQGNTIAEEEAIKLGRKNPDTYPFQCAAFTKHLAICSLYLKFALEKMSNRAPEIRSLLKV